LLLFYKISGTAKAFSHSLGRLLPVRSWWASIHRLWLLLINPLRTVASVRFRVAQFSLRARRARATRRWRELPRHWN